MADIELRLGKRYGDYVALRHPASVLVLKSSDTARLAEMEVLRSLSEADIPLLVWDSAGDLARSGWRTRHAAGPVAAVAWGADAGLFDPIAEPWLPPEGREAYLRLVASHLAPAAMQPLLVDVLLALLQTPEQFGRILTGRHGQSSFAFLSRISEAFGEAAAAGSSLRLARRLAEMGIAGNLVRSLIFSSPDEGGALLRDFADALAPLRWQAPRHEYGQIDVDMLNRPGATTAYLTHEDALGAQFVALALSIMIDRVPSTGGACEAAVVIDLDSRLENVRSAYRTVAACRSLGLSVVLCVETAATLREAGFRSPAAVRTLFDATLCMDQPDLATVDWLEDPVAALSPLGRSRRRLERLLPVLASDCSLRSRAAQLQEGDGMLLLSSRPEVPTVLQVA